VQNARKEAGLDLLDKIALHLGTESPELKKAIATHKKDIATAVQAVGWSETPLTGEVHTSTAKIDGQSLTILIRKVKL
jgi:isoleucyl-tRNA synthetase